MNAIKFIVSLHRRLLRTGWQQEKLIPKHLPRNVVVAVVVAVVAGPEIAHAYANMSQLSFQLKLVHCTFILVARACIQIKKDLERWPGHRLLRRLQVLMMLMWLLFFLLLVLSCYSPCVSCVSEKSYELCV